jgi:hypothetical protein
MGNEYDYKCKGFELKAVPRSEFEALKRFGDYEELDGNASIPVKFDFKYPLLTCWQAAR